MTALPEFGYPCLPAVELTDLERAVLALEHRWWIQPGRKDQAILDELGLGVTRYYQLLNAVLDKPAALVHDPVLIKRLRRLREQREFRRTG